MRPLLTGTRASAERGLGGEPAAVWLYAERLTLVYRDQPPARYRVADQPDRRRLQTVTPAQLVGTPHRSPPPPRWTRGEDEWLPLLRLPADAPRESRPPGAVQPPPFALAAVGAYAEPGASPTPRAATPECNHGPRTPWRGVMYDSSFSCGWSRRWALSCAGSVVATVSTPTRAPAGCSTFNRAVTAKR
jgi:hypothetical protein